MHIMAWEQFLNDQTQWPEVTYVGNITPATMLIRHKRMRPAERHQQILQAATKVIALKGFWGMSMQDVADEIGITEAALYHYVSSKNELLTMVLNEAYDTSDADEYNAANATITDYDGHRVCFYPRYCLNIVLFNMQRPTMVQLFCMLYGEALNPKHPAHKFFIEHHRRNWNLVRSMDWVLPPGITEKQLYQTFSLAMAAMDGLQYRWLADESLNPLKEWIKFSNQIFPEDEWAGFTDPSEYNLESSQCLLPFTLRSASHHGANDITAG